MPKEEFSDSQNYYNSVTLFMPTRFGSWAQPISPIHGDSTSLLLAINLQAQRSSLKLATPPRENSPHVYRSAT
jgi:hypothetical protein